MGNLELILNIVIIFLLVPTIFYAIKLNSNLNILRNNQKSLARLVESLNEATFKAETSIPKLKNITQSSSTDLKEVVVKAKELKEDLSFINQRADGLADRLEGVIRENREKTLSDSRVEKVDQSSAEMELLKALRSIK